MQSIRARLHCLGHCCASTLGFSLCWATGHILGQTFAGLAASLTFTGMAPGIMLGLVFGFATMPVYLIVVK